MKIGIIGAGKVGISVGYVLKNNGINVAVISDMSEVHLETAREFLGIDTFYSTNNLDVVKEADVVAVTTQDREIAGIARAISGKVSDLTDKLFFHTSGADSRHILSPLGEKRARIGSLHPLQTFPDIESAIEALPDTSIFIEGDEKALETLRFLGENLGAKVYTIESDDKVLYHLAAVFVCNLLCALMYAGKGVMDKIDVGFEPFLPIIKATMKNIENKGPLQALTGPIVRGDDRTVRSHLKAMRGMGLHRETYRALSKIALQMATEKGEILGEEAAIMHRILESSDG